MATRGARSGRGACLPSLRADLGRALVASAQPPGRSSSATRPRPTTLAPRPPPAPRRQLCPAARRGWAPRAGAGRGGGTAHRLSRLLRRRHEWLKGQTARSSVRPRWSRTGRSVARKGQDLAPHGADLRRAAADLGLPPADLSPPAPRSLPACPRSWAKKPEIFGRAPRDLGQKSEDLADFGPRSWGAWPKICAPRAADLRPPRGRSAPRSAGTSPEICGQI